MSGSPKCISNQLSEALVAAWALSLPEQSTLQNQTNQQSAKPEKPGQLIVDDTMTKESAKSLKDIKYIYIASFGLRT